MDAGESGITGTKMPRRRWVNHSIIYIIVSYSMSRRVYAWLDPTSESVRVRTYPSRRVLLCITFVIMICAGDPAYMGPGLHHVPAEYGHPKAQGGKSSGYRSRPSIGYPICQRRRASYRRGRCPRS
jgi:hypothetical protein